MGSYSENEDQFFDARQVFDKMSDSESEDCSTSGFGYDYWIENLDGVDSRRNKLLRFMGLNSRWLVNRDREDDYESEDYYFDEIEPEKSQFQDDFFRRQPLLSDWSSKPMELVPSVNDHDHLVVKTGNLDESSEDMLIKRSFDFTTDGLIENKVSPKEGEAVNLLDRRKKVKKGWLQKLNVISRITDKPDESMSFKPNASTRSVHVHTHKKKSKELSSVYTTQDFSAHNGPISMIKFSHDGRYLASAGEDCIIRIWKISEDQDPKLYQIQGTDPSSFYFATNHLSELAPLKANKEKTRKIKGFGKSSELACVILPLKIFRILEKPVHEFNGHSGEILSLSWSKKGYLLSSSVDKTVRMWKLGHQECLKTFIHYNYVTCVEFNPVDDNYFISGSIDGKVRIWDVHSCQVIDWIDLGDIITAVCYNPDAKGSIVGTLDGKCSFYDIIDDRMQLRTQICSISKKKWPKRITGFQFCPTDSRKVIVSSADSQVKIICGIDVVGKFKGNRSSGSQMSACFTSDGKHIISAADDSNIYIWNHISPDKLFTKPKTNLSYENFLSQNTTMAIPWCGIKTIAAALPSPRFALNYSLNNNINNVVVPRSIIDSPRILSPSTTRGFFLESLLKGPPTWPAETLPDSAQVSVSPSMRKSEYRFLKNVYQSTFMAPHMWGLVIVAAEMKINKEWSVCCGENSKEVDVQTNRIKREKEVFYNTILDIPQNPKEPWDREMDYDDSLTPEIPIEQPPDEDDDMIVTPPTAPDSTSNYAVGTSTLPENNRNMPEPDFELLAVLLKNPQIVFALTAGQGGSLSNDQMVKLLDAIKVNAASGGSINSLVNGLVERKTEETVEVSLPSPTPSSNPVTSGWRSESSKNQFSRQSVTVNGEGYVIPGVYFQETTQQAIAPITHQRLPDVVLDHRNISNLVTDRRNFQAVQGEQSIHPRFSDMVPDQRHLQGANASSDAYFLPGYNASQLQQPQLSPYSPSDHSTNYNAYGTGEFAQPVRSHEYNGWDYSDPNDHRSNSYRQETSRMKHEPPTRYGYRGGRNDSSRWRDRRR